MIPEHPLAHKARAGAVQYSARDASPAPGRGGAGMAIEPGRQTLDAAVPEEEGGDRRGRVLRSLRRAGSGRASGQDGRGSIGVPRIGEKLRELRGRRGLGMRELALRSGVSHSAISLIERDRMSPSVDTLAAILAALGSTMAALFGDLDSGLPYSPFYTAAELTEIGRADRVSYRLVGMNHPNRHMLLLQERYAPGATTDSAVAHAAEEAGIVTMGAVEVTVGGQARVLREGDAYYFDSRKPHRFRNMSDGVSEIISAVTPPTY